jgi:hypothetical protein
VITGLRPQRLTGHSAHHVGESLREFADLAALVSVVKTRVAQKGGGWLGPGHALASVQPQPQWLRARMLKLL